MNQDKKIELVKLAIQKLYTIDKELIERDLCERCLVSRLAFHLANTEEFKNYFVDCEFNKAFNAHENTLKRLSSQKGNYVDIIIHKRSNPLGNNLLCFEIKKSSNKNTQMIEKDKENLRKLTTNPYFYTLGFQINLGRSHEETKIQVYAQGQIIAEVG